MEIPFDEPKKEEIETYLREIKGLTETIIKINKNRDNYTIYYVDKIININKQELISWKNSDKNNNNKNRNITENKDNKIIKKNEITIIRDGLKTTTITKDGRIIIEEKIIMKNERIKNKIKKIIMKNGTIWEGI